MQDVLLGLGSNVGDRQAYLDQAVQLLNEHDFIQIEAVSTFIETEAVTTIKQPNFINGACRIKTILSPKELLSVTNAIEQKLGRVSKGNYDPRTVDIDILFYGDEIISETDLIIPHPLVHERDFVLIPLLEIASEFVHPMLQQSVEELHTQVVGY